MDGYHHQLKSTNERHCRPQGSNKMSKQYKVKEHRGSSRLWLEGNTLKNLGFNYQDQYSGIYYPETKEIVIALDQDGDRKVSGRKRKGMDHHSPILDLCSSEVTKTMIGCSHFIIDPTSEDGFMVLRGVDHHG